MLHQRRSTQELQVGVMLPTRNIVTDKASSSNALREMVSAAQVLDGLGCDSVWVGDSLLGRPRPEPITVLAAIAATTQHIKLGTATLLPAMRNPLQLTQQLATLDLLSEGRLIVGVGSGFPNDQTRTELEALGLDYHQRIRRCHEVVSWCRAIWGGQAPIQPKFWELTGVEVPPAPVQEGGPKFWLGGSTAPTCRTVGRLYDGWMPTSPHSDKYADSWQIVSDSANQAGRNAEGITASTVLTLSVDDDGRKARQQLREFIERYYQAPLEAAQEVVGCRAGTIEEVAHEIQQFEAAGVRHIIVRFAATDQTAEIGRWMAPLLAALGR